MQWLFVSSTKTPVKRIADFGYIDSKGFLKLGLSITDTNTVTDDAHNFSNQKDCKGKYYRKKCLHVRNESYLTTFQTKMHEGCE